VGAIERPFIWSLGAIEGPAQYATVWSANGGTLVRLNEDARRCVVFFGVAGENGIEYGGTGFLATDQEEGLNIAFLITCRHVAELLSRHDEFFMRLNLKGGDAEDLPLQNIQWSYHPDPSIDLAAVCIVISAERYEIAFAPLHDYRTITDRSIRPGDPINLVGLFRLHAGRKRNVPFVHCGHVAVLPDTAEKVPVRDRITNKLVMSEVYLIEAQTLDGLSGSPVIVHEEVSLSGTSDRMGGLGKLHGSARLLGVYLGSWDGEPGTILAADRDLRGNKRVPVGVGLVAPADQLLQLVREHPTLIRDRKNLATAALAQKAASQDAAISDPQSSDENPTHREDFTRLVNAAARKPPQAD
jgi:hypothetical protein